MSWFSLAVRITNEEQENQIRQTGFAYSRFSFFTYILLKSKSRKMKTDDMEINIQTDQYRERNYLENFHENDGKKELINVLINLLGKISFNIRRFMLT